jgi:hypothetical protein
MSHRIEHGNGVYLAAPALLLELAADDAVHQSIENEPRPPLDVVEHAFEMAFGADHRPEVALHLRAFKLGEAGIGDHLQRFASRIREEMEVELGHAAGLWKSMGRSLAKPLGAIQRKRPSPFCPFSPTASRTGGEKRPQHVENGDEARDSQGFRGALRRQPVCKSGRRE